MNRRTFITSTVGAGIAASSAPAFAAKQPGVSFDPKKIDAIFASLDQRTLPGAAVGIAIEGKPVYRNGFGLANMEGTDVLAPTTRMRISLASRHFTSLAYLLLCEDGKARIDDTVGKYFPELSPVTHKVTMRQLMANMSCLRDPYDLCFQFNGIGPGVTAADLLSVYRTVNDVNAQPGTSYNYNHGDYLLLGTAIERITGRPFADMLRERLFEPVGMRSTLVRHRDTDYVANSAAAHMKSSEGVYEKWYCMDFAGGGSIVSTVDDMLGWLAHMDAPKFGGESTWSSIKAEQTTANGTGTGYGLGLMPGRYRGVDTLQHSGPWFGANAHMVKVPSAGLDVMVMVNRSDVSAAGLGGKILDACLTNLDPVEKPFAGPMATGLFRSADGRVVHLFERAGQQIMSIDGQQLPAVSGGEGLLRAMPLTATPKQIVTLVGDPARPTSIRFSEFGNVREMSAVKLVDAPDAGRIVGRYRSESTGITLTITRTGSGAQLHSSGRFGAMGYELVGLADGIWRVKSTSMPFLGGMLAFDDDGATCRFSDLLTLSLPFRRV